jgi:exodeoxyribonuclease VII small subunit
MKMSQEQEVVPFEAALAELEEIVERLEIGELSLEESLELFERGQALSRLCMEQLETATLRVEQLTEEGEIREVRVE